MSNHWKHLSALALALMLIVCALPVHAQAAEAAPAIFTELVATDVTLDKTEFEYTGEEIRPNVTVRVNGQLLTLDKDYYLDYANNIQVGEAKVIVTGIATSGYAGTVEHPFFITAKEEENEDEEQEPEFTLIQLKGTDVIIEGTEFLYTGSPIEPAVTVTVEGKTLVKDRDYAVEYINNLVPGTATVIVRGIATASETVGYTGEVRMDYTIRSRTEDTYPLVEITAKDVTIDGKEFPYTGKAIEPKITVTVDGKVLTAGKDYNLRYSNNIEPGTGIATVTGIATATESGGYTGEVQVKFTITKAPEAPTYKVTHGDGSVWYQGSISALSFTVDAPRAEFTGLSLNGKALDQNHFAVKDGTTVLLKNEYLKTLKTGNYKLTFHFENGEAEAAFEIAAATDNPKTGDSIVVWGMLMLLSLMGLASAAFVLRKQQA